MIVPMQHAEGVLLPVRAQPGARRNQIVGEQNGALKVAVTAPADQGKANKAILESLAESLGIKKSHVELASGPTSREKKVLLRGISLQKVKEWLASLGVPVEE